MNISISDGFEQTDIEINKKNIFIISSKNYFDKLLVF